MKSSQIKAAFYLLPLVITLLIHAQSSSPRFEHLSVEQGLSHHSVTCMVQDDQGFLWFGTQAGLNRYDGHSFKVFRINPLDSNSLSNDFIYQIIKPRDPLDQVLWIGTRFGLNKLDLRTEQFTSYIDGALASDKSDKNIINGNIIFDLAEDFSGNIWLATDDGLKMFNPETEKIMQVIKGQIIKQVCFNHSGTLWVGSTGRKSHDGKTANIFKYDQSIGNVEEVLYPIELRPNNDALNFIYCSPNETEDMLWYDAAKHWLVHYNTVEKTHVLFEYVDDYEGNYNPGLINSIIEDRRGYLWIGTRSDLIRFDRETGKIKHYYMKSGDKSIWESNFINCLFLDNSDVLWIGTHDGIYSLNLQPKPFTNYQHQVGDKNSLNSNVVTSIYIDSSSLLWVGTTRDMNRIDHDNNSIGLFPPDKEVVVDITVYDIYSGADGYMYFANSWGISRCDSNKAGSSAFKIYRNEIINDVDDPEVSGAPIGSPGFDIEIDVDGQIWLATAVGLDHFDRKTELFTHYFPGDAINMLLNPKLGFSFELLLGTQLYGIIRFDRIQRQVISIHSNNPTVAGSISNNQVNDIFEDSKADIWVATNYGLNLMQRHMNPDSTSFITYTQEDGLPSNIIKSIQEDSRGNLWLGTGDGLSRFDPETKIFTNYDIRDGLPGNNFVANASLRGPGGELLFGTDAGLTTFFPDSLPESMTDNPHIPPVVLTDFQIFNKSVPIYPLPGDNTSNSYSLPQTISQLEAIELSYQQNVFSFEFAALDYQNFMSNQYAYKMEGFNQEWIYTDASNRIASYTNLDPGNYVFHVKGSNNDGLWNEKGTSIRVVITPPWWKTNIAYFGYFLLVMVTFTIFNRIRLARVRLQHQAEIDHLEAERYHELDKMKSRFFANISHEFRTPLTLILGPVAKMLGRVKDTESERDLTLMQRQAKRLLELVTQLLDLSKLEAGKMKIQVSQRNIVPLLKGLTLSFASLAERDKIALAFDSELEDIQVFIEKGAITKIINNLLSNSFKFTETGGSIQVTVTSNEESGLSNDGEICIAISDNGIGIPAERLDYIFNRFYQIDSGETRAREGTGIGLALAKELVELHHGEIQVESEVDRGTTFTVRLPLGKEHLKPEEIVEKPLEEPVTLGTPISFTEVETEPQAETIQSSKKSVPVVLIVEDNTDVREFIRSYLDQAYRNIEAKDGEEGLKKAIDKMPDLIISDIMMPRMDGVEFCKRIKTDERTSHIPVILLTAKADTEAKIEGLETGADDYITKPFDARELQVRVRNLIEQRKKLRERFMSKATFKPQDLAVTSMDEKFLTRAMDIVEEHMSEYDFSVDEFSRAIGMSRVHLHRKMRALTGISASKFIRMLRLMRAASFLQQKYGNVTEVAYEVGFNNLSYFARCFRRQFGEAPSKYAARGPKINPMS